MNLSLRASALFVASFLCVGAFSPALHAQDEYYGRNATAGLTVGADFSGGASLILQPPDGSKVGPIFAWRAGADISYPLIPVISAGLALGLDSRGTELHSISSSEIYTITRVMYFSITPSFNFNGFYIGLNMGIPMSGSTTTKFGSLSAESSTDMTDADFNKVEFMLEPRIGANILLVDAEAGLLTMNITGGYTLSTLQDLGAAASLDNAGDYHMASLHLGLSYQFAIPNTRHK